MTMHEKDVHQSTSRQFVRNAAVGAVGLAAVLGSGMYLITAQNGDYGNAGAMELVAAAQPDPAGTAAPPAGDVDDQTRKEINDARAAAAADGIKLMRPPAAQGAAVPAGAVTTATERTASGTIQINTAKRDLSGLGTRLLAANGGRSAGDGISCTQSLRFSADAPARTTPKMLLCWKTSAKRSVVTLATAASGAPSASASAAIIAREWVKLG